MKRAEIQDVRTKLNSLQRNFFSTCVYVPCFLLLEALKVARRAPYARGVSPSQEKKRIIPVVQSSIAACPQQALLPLPSQLAVDMQS